MADTAFKTQYRDEFIAGFEQGASKFMNTAVTERQLNGNTCVFLVADTGGAEATTRGTNGLIPGRPDNLTQNSCVLQEWHDKPQRTRFNIFASQGDGRRILQAGSRKVINRKVDDLMITELSTGTNDTGAASTMSLQLVTKAIAILGENDVDVDEEDNMFAAVSPAAMSYMAQIPEFMSADYVEMKGFGASMLKAKRWLGVNWFQSNRLSGRTTTAEKLLMWHRNAIGWAADTDNMDVAAGYNEEHDYYFARATIFANAKLLQNSGVVVINHDGSQIVAS